MKTLKQLVKEAFNLLGEDFSLANAFDDKNIKNEGGQSPTAYQQLIGVLENTPKFDNKLLNNSDKVRNAELIGTCYKLFKQAAAAGKKYDNITYDPKDNTYSANTKKDYGSKNENLISINRKYILDTIKAKNSEFDDAIAIIQKKLANYSYGTYDLGQTISCTNKKLFTIDGNKITITVPAGGGQNSTKGLKMYTSAKDFVTTIDKENGYTCFRINNSDNFIFVSPEKKYGIFVISPELNTERPYLADPEVLQGIVRGLADKISVKPGIHTDTEQRRTPINRNNVVKDPYISIPKLLVYKASRGDEKALKWYQQLQMIATRYKLEVKRTNSYTASVPNKLYEIKKIGNIVDNVNSYLNQFIP